MGNPEFAVPSLKKIIESEYSLLAVVSNPAKPTGRKKAEKIIKVGEFAKRQCIPLFQPQILDDPEFLAEMNTLNPDYFLVVAFKILPVPLLDIPKKGSINLHASLLPKYRGASPIQYALLNGDKVTGLTTFYINETIDEGDIIYQLEYKISDTITFNTLSDVTYSDCKITVTDSLGNLKWTPSQGQFLS